MKLGRFAVLCVFLLALWATGAKAQDHEKRIKQLEDRIVELDGRFDRIKEEYDKKLAEKLNAFESVYSLAKVPVGTILPFYGDPSKLPANWKLCDGKKVTDRESPFLNQDLPDLRERFLRGALNNVDLGSGGGQDVVDDHSHKIVGTAQDISFPVDGVYPWTSTYKVPIGVDTEGVLPGHHVRLKFTELAMILTVNATNTTRPGFGHGHVGGTGVISGMAQGDGGFDNRPSYISVYFVIRIK